MKTKVLVCSCNGTIDIAGARLGAGLPPSVEVLPATRELCRREISRFTDAIGGTDDVVVACTQESALFSELAAAKQAVAPVRFVNVRELAGWGEQGAGAGPKIAALVAIAASAGIDPVPAVEYRSQGRVLVVGPGREAIDWAERLASHLSPTVLMTDTRAASLPIARSFPVLSGTPVSIAGWLGDFEARWTQDNPIDLDACVRCGACVEACPESAIGADLQVDAALCKSHRACVAACGPIGAIDFARGQRERSERFDLVFDLRADSMFDCRLQPLGDTCRSCSVTRLGTPMFESHQPPQGYFHPGRSEKDRSRMALELVAMVGEFEKPKYFRYREKMCAHGRNQIVGCTACIDVCSTRAIESAGDRIRVEPHLCMGCGGCTTVCPSGAISYQYPTPARLMEPVRQGLSAYRERGGRDALILFHDEESGRLLLESLSRAPRGARGPARAAPSGRGLPARVIPVSVRHVGSVGIDVALAALAYGASQVAVLAAPGIAPQYREATTAQFAVAQALVGAAGYAGKHFLVVDASRPDWVDGLFALQAADGVARAATFGLSEDKRRSIEFALDHLVAQAASRGHVVPQSVPLPAGAPFGSLKLQRDSCTLCLACIGACPESALLDNPDSPQVRFIERNCVQCGLCVKTCPEQAITLEPRYVFSEETRTPVVLNEAQPFACISCGKPFGTRQMIENMLGKLSGHSMFGGEATRRLQMCADCRIVDMFSRSDETTIVALDERRRP
ncbi:MAG: 4Fe-4S binding protein [Burkholderiaceae bacterium]|nr:4Fe-4S binding protein [Burkholderiaceae bacterium]